MAGPYKTEQISRLANTLVPNSAGAVYTNSTGNKVMLTGLMLHNSSAGSATVELWFVESAGSRTATNKAYKITLAQDDTVQLNENFRPILEAGDAIHGVCSAASAVSLFAYGVEIAVIS